MKYKKILPEELLREIGQVELIDIRERFEYDIIRLKPAKLIPMGNLMERLDEIDWSKKVVIYCRTGSRTRLIAQDILRTGREVHDLGGGIRACYQNPEYSPHLHICGDTANYF